ncbi:hypothetical protein DAPPUDRAFT_329536 [Daphnia pulex]|uniref:Phospholipase A2 n=1 Tax=Daphnia pulex TaxID=6669 RepID=E9HGW5_DAPPU|nr:hypothetical protein DAPPUDRAFT_329536 [Daphnia pulex]|eukprot:EFX69030.1 hypothetical protein DAPPUDRAFT_329536 [Daphnia pulex]
MFKVILYTRASPLRLLYYGNWCGSGGMGPALDNIDQCCMTHDKCYGDVERLPCKGIFQTPYSVHYAWRWVEDRKQAYCRTYENQNSFSNRKIFELAFEIEIQNQCRDRRSGLHEREKKKVLVKE